MAEPAGPDDTCALSRAAQEPLAFDNGQDEQAARFDAVDDPVVPQQHLADVGVPDLRHDASLAGGGPCASPPLRPLISSLTPVPHRRPPPGRARPRSALLFRK